VLGLRAVRGVWCRPTPTTTPTRGFADMTIILHIICFVLARGGGDAISRRGGCASVVGSSVRRSVVCFVRIIIIHSMYFVFPSWKCVHYLSCEYSAYPRSMCDVLFI